MFTNLPNEIVHNYHLISHLMATVKRKKCLDFDTVPEAGEFCEYCAYAHSVSKF